MKNLLFESYPDCTGSPLAIYNALIKLGYDNQYNLVWASDRNGVSNGMKTVNWFGPGHVDRKSFLSNTKLIVDSNRYIQKDYGALRLHTRHGCTLKNVPSYTQSIGPVDVILSTSDTMTAIDRYIYPTAIHSRFITTGYPANDALGCNSFDRVIRLVQSKRSGLTKVSQIIGWFPTYRQHRNCPKLGTSKVFRYGLPIITNELDIEHINDILSKTNTVMLVQYHHAQALNYTSIKQYSNIIVISDADLFQHGLTILSLLTGLTALITDYSSIYYEYLLLGRPIALTIPDIIEYNATFGFCFDYRSLIHGTYVVGMCALCKFITTVAESKLFDLSFQSESIHKVHRFTDFKSTERVVNLMQTTKMI